MLGLASAMVPSQNIDALKQSLIRSCETDEIEKIIASYQTDPGLPCLASI